jgi:hypothetical protein
MVLTSTAGWAATFSEPEVKRGLLKPKGVRFKKWTGR